MRNTLVFLISLGFLLSPFTQVVEAEQQDIKKMQERIEFLTMWKMMEALDLDKPTAEKILEIRKGFLSQRQDLLVSLQDDFQNLRKMLKETPRGQENEKELAEMLSQIRDKRKKLEAVDDQLYVQVSQVLTVRQQAELILFLKDFRRDMRMHQPPFGPPPPPHGPIPGGPPQLDSELGTGLDPEMGPRLPRGDPPEKPGPGRELPKR